MKNGEIKIPNGCRPHHKEILAAQAFTRLGINVTFLRPHDDLYRVQTPDVEIGGLKWEIKTPTSSKIETVERNLKRAVRQSGNIIFDCRGMKNLPSFKIRRELIKQARLSKSIRHLKMIDRHGKIIDIK